MGIFLKKNYRLKKVDETAKNKVYLKKVWKTFFHTIICMNHFYFIHSENCNGLGIRKKEWLLPIGPDIQKFMGNGQKKFIYHHT